MSSITTTSPSPGAPPPAWPATPEPCSVPPASRDSTPLSWVSACSVVQTVWRVLRLVRAAAWPALPLTTCSLTVHPAWPVFGRVWPAINHLQWVSVWSAGRGTPYLTALVSPTLVPSTTAWSATEAAAYSACLGISSWTGTACLESSPAT